MTLIKTNMLKNLLNFFQNNNISSTESEILQAISNINEDEMIFGYHPDKSIASIPINEIQNTMLFGGMGSGKSVCLSFLTYLLLAKNSHNIQIFNLLGEYARNSDYFFLYPFENYHEFFQENSIEALAIISNEINKRKELLTKGNSIKNLPKIFIIIDDACFGDPWMQSVLFKNKIKLSFLSDITQNSHQYGIFIFNTAQSYNMRNNLFPVEFFQQHIVFKMQYDLSIRLLGDTRATDLSRGSFYSTYFKTEINPFKFDKKVLTNLAEKFNKELNKENLYITKEMLDKIRYKS